MRLDVTAGLARLVVARLAVALRLQLFKLGVHVVKHDLYKWQEVYPGEAFDIPRGLCWLRATAPIVVFAESGDFQSIAGTGAEVRFEVQAACSITVQAFGLFDEEARSRARDQLRVFLYEREPAIHFPQGEVFSNPDRPLHQSGYLDEVLRARRLFELERREAQRIMREDAARHRAEMEKISLAVKGTVAESAAASPGKMQPEVQPGEPKVETSQDEKAKA